MSVINIQKSRFLIGLLQKMLLGLTALNKSDPSLSQVATKIKELLSSEQVESTYILQLIMRAKDIVASYGVKPTSDKPTEDPVEALPGIFYNAVEELDHVITTQRIMDKLSGKTRRDELFKKLAAYRKAI